MGCETLLAAARANGLELGVEEDMSPLEKVSDDVLKLMACTKDRSGFEKILNYPHTRKYEAKWTLF